MHDKLLIIPRDVHRLDPGRICPRAIEVIQRLRQAGFAAYLVGGGVRDLLLGHQPKDFDIATDAHPDDIVRLFRRCRLVGRRFRIAHVYFGREFIEVATFRAAAAPAADGDSEIQGDDSGVERDLGDRHVENGRIVRDNVFGTEAEDAWRRDFTVNALMYDPLDETIRDHVGGFADVQARRLRLIGDPKTRYREDPVRMIRAIRFVAARGLELDAAGRAPLAQLAPLIADVAPARLFEEVCKVFLSGYGQRAFELMAEYGLFQQLFPLIEVRCEDGHWRANPILETAFANTDHRVRTGKPVTPGFLFAALLWQPLQRQIDQLNSEGLQGMDAVYEAMEAVLAEQVQRVAVPRRYTMISRDIWLMQPRFRRMRGRRVLRFIAERRFRAAYDFLLLRVLTDPDLQPVAEWWTKIQEAPLEVQEKMAGLAPGEAAAESLAGASRREGGSPPRRVRRRGGRRRRGGGIQPAGE